MNITVTYGAKSQSWDFDAPITVGEVLGKSFVKDYLQYGESIRATIDQVEASMSDELADGDEIEVLTKSNSKA